MEKMKQIRRLSRQVNSIMCSFIYLLTYLFLIYYFRIFFISRKLRFYSATCELFVFFRKHLVFWLILIHGAVLLGIF